MKICVFYDYEVHLTNRYSYVTDKEFGETSYAEEIEEWTKTINGCELINIIVNLLQNTETISIESDSNEIQIDQFDPWSGSGANIKITYKEVRCEQEKIC